MVRGSYFKLFSRYPYADFSFAISCSHFFLSQFRGLYMEQAGRCTENILFGVLRWVLSMDFEKV